MTEEELKALAKEMGYVVAKKPCYQCSCYCQYPNKNHKNKNGKWKCVDSYRPIKLKSKWWYGPITHCQKIEGNACIESEKE